MTSAPAQTRDIPWKTFGTLTSQIFSRSTTIAEDEFHPCVRNEHPHVSASRPSVGTWQDWTTANHQTNGRSLCSLRQRKRNMDLGRQLWEVHVAWCHVQSMSILSHQGIPMLLSSHHLSRTRCPTFLPCCLHGKANGPPDQRT